MPLPGAQRPRCCATVVRDGAAVPWKRARPGAGARRSRAGGELWAPLRRATTLARAREHPGGDGGGTAPSGGGGNDAGGGQGGGGHGWNPGDGSGRRRCRVAWAVALAGALTAGGSTLTSRRATERARQREPDGPPQSVSIIVPALNEEKALGATLAALRILEPRPAEVIVSVGPSTDRTARIAAAAGCRVLRGGKGRAVQMDDAAAAARGDLLLFIHADTLVPRDVVAIARRTLADPATVAGGFVSLITSASLDRTYWGMSLHNVVKTWYLPLLFRPAAFARGLRALFGDQAIFCRRTDYAAVGGFDRRLPIMEDLELCMRLHYAGPASGAARRGRIRLVDRVVVTDGRRFDVWGNGRATLVHFAIGLAWYGGASAQQLVDLYRRIYGDIR